MEHQCLEQFNLVPRAFPFSRPSQFPRLPREKLWKRGIERFSQRGIRVFHDSFGQMRIAFNTELKTALVENEEATK